MEPQDVETIIRHLAAAIAKQESINEDLRTCIQEQREFNRQQVAINTDVKVTLVEPGRNYPSLYTVNGRPLYVHLNGLAIVVLK
jgi:hypothetical protein